MDNTEFVPLFPGMDPNTLAATPSNPALATDMSATGIHSSDECVEFQADSPEDVGDNVQEEGPNTEETSVPATGIVEAQENNDAQTQAKDEQNPEASKKSVTTSKQSNKKPSDRISAERDLVSRLLAETDLDEAEQFENQDPQQLLTDFHIVRQKLHKACGLIKCKEAEQYVQNELVEVGMVTIGLSGSSGLENQPELSFAVGPNHYSLKLLAQINKRGGGGAGKSDYWILSWIL